MPPATALLADAPPSARSSALCVNSHAATFVPSALPAAVSAALWRGDQLGSAVARVYSSGFEALDAALPGGGWPGHSLTEILTAQSGTLEWRLLGGVLRDVCVAGRSVVLVGPPREPHVPGLRLAGLSEKQLVWIQAETPAERLWSAEQLIKANACGALIAWLPQVRAEQIRRLQVLAAGCEAPVFVCRPASAAQEPSAAPLRLLTRAGLDWELLVDVFKRKGPPLEATLRLPSVPAGLQSILTPRLRVPSALLPRDPVRVVGVVDVREAEHALVRTPVAPAERRHRTAPH
jgi:protein ImuA